MSQQPGTSLRDRFNKVSSATTSMVGSPFALASAVGIVLVWALSGPIFNFSETWQLVINTGTTIITFLMVFVIQASQNRDSKALHLKLDEVIRAVEGARNELITAESSSEEEIRSHEQEFLRIAHEGGRAAAEEAQAGSEPQDAARAAVASPDVREAAREAAERAVRDAQRTDRSA